jgi:HK97 family phage major capsid protein
VNLREKRERRAAIVGEMKDMLGVAEAAGRDLSAEEKPRYDGLENEFDSLGAQIDREERNAKREAQLAQPLHPETPRANPGAGDGENREMRANATPEYRKAFSQYLRGNGQSAELRALAMDTDTSGGFVVAPQEFSDQLIKFVDNQVFIRGLATVARVENAQSLGVPSLTADPDDADWTVELGTGNEDSAMAFGKREFRPHPLAKRIKVSAKLLRAATAFRVASRDAGGAANGSTVDDLVLARLGYKFGVAEEKSFMTGTGAQQPLGLFTASADGIPTSRDVLTAGATAIVADDLINVLYSLKPQYQQTARWGFNRTVVQVIRKVKDTNGQYVWAAGAIGQASLAAGQPDTILGKPYFMSEYVPNTVTANLYTGICGDFSFYWIADALDVTVQRLVELYAETNQVGFIGRKETDGMPVLAEAFARLTQHS